ncbi:hypothetical protein GLAREA_11217 [Glarea lozoyensis ATCC 20868]|uniref:Uncharacterized protein n=1 Tax=Glarea lozoyensis (strain ATCC 20868 / MF5171) TaxID=1116229 RepID=S3EB17_GLAL2|nr:uncharacterized protein GLAREA_11217 [Glarea lozoyensis ATCC 20868]EPE35518.1 hypothetical protein GLAREA_11217 [Glarea lozoyensis ATCC 20868]
MGQKSPSDNEDELGGPRTTCFGSAHHSVLPYDSDAAAYQKRSSCPLVSSTWTDGIRGARPRTHLIRCPLGMVRTTNRQRDRMYMGRGGGLAGGTAAVDRIGTALDLHCFRPAGGCRSRVGGWPRGAEEMQWGESSIIHFRLFVGHITNDRE